MFSIFKRKEKIDINKLNKLDGLTDSNIDSEVSGEVSEENVTEIPKYVNKHKLDQNLSVYEMINIIEKDIINFGEKKTEILKWYYFYKMFTYVVKKDDYFNEAKLSLDKDINQLKRNNEDINRYLRKIKIVAKPTKEECNSLYDNINDLYDFSKYIQNEISDYRQNYFLKQKVSSMAMANEKSADDLEKLCAKIEELVEEYKGFDRLVEYVEYNSSSLINETIDAFLECINEVSSTKHNRRYFLGSDYCLHLTKNEWITLFGKMIKTYKQLSNRSDKISHIKLLRLNRKYQELEVRFFIILISNESLD